MLADTLTGSVTYTKVAADTESGTKYVYNAGEGGASQPYQVIVKHDVPANNRKGTVRHLVSFSRPILDSAGEPLASGERITVNFTVAFPNVPFADGVIDACCLDALIVLSNATAADTFLNNVVDGMF